MNPNNLSITDEFKLAEKRIAEKKRKRTNSMQQVPEQQVPMQQDFMQQFPKQQVPMQQVPMQQVPMQQVPMQQDFMQQFPKQQVPIQHIRKQKNSRQQVPMQQDSMQQVPKQQVPKQQVPKQQIPPEKKRRTIQYDSRASSSSSVKPNSLVSRQTNMTKPGLSYTTNSEVQTQQLEPPLLRKQETDFDSVLDDLNKLNVKASTPQASPTPTDGTNDERGKKHPPTMQVIISKLYEIQKEKDNSP